jgi:hypothetical protein
MTASQFLLDAGVFLLIFVFLKRLFGAWVPKLPSVELDRRMLMWAGGVLGFVLPIWAISIKGADLGLALVPVVVCMVVGLFVILALVVNLLLEAQARR